MPLATSTLPQNAEMFKFPSRRSVVHSTRGIVSCSQPLAAKCGIEVLQAGGNAADAAVAVAAGLNMTEPCSTGIGGDMFVLYWDAAENKVFALNGSGRSGKDYSIDKVRSDLGISDGETGSIPATSPHSVTVPGAAAGWVDTVEKFGSAKVDMAQILAPAIRLGEDGFPVSEIASYYWHKQEQSIRNASPNYSEMLKKDPNAPDGVRAPKAGEIMKNPALAQTFRTLAAEGKKGFYTGRIAEELVKVLQSRGGILSLDDLQHHLQTGTDVVDPISLKFTGQGLGEGGGLELWECPPNGQGIIALQSLGIIQELEKQGTIPTFNPGDITSAPYLHAIIEALRLSFGDARWYVRDPVGGKIPTDGLLSSEYLSERAKLFDPTRAMDTVKHGEPAISASPALRSSDTVYFTVSDAQGNAASFINSNYMGFGSSIIPKGCGFTLQNRGSGFSLDPNHPNSLEPRKRPYHTIIPGMVTNISDGSLHSSFGVMGGFMQPQGHLQVLLGQVVGNLDPQQALDVPRICIGPGMSHDMDVSDVVVYVEEGIPDKTIAELTELGHNVKVLRGAERGMFGRGQIIRSFVDPIENVMVWSAGSDMRADGAAYAF